MDDPNPQAAATWKAPPPAQPLAPVASPPTFAVIIAAYQAAGFALKDHLKRKDWTTLVLEKV